MNLNKLEELARAATPGPWFYQEESDAYTHIVRAESQPNLIVASGCQSSAATGAPTGRFIAATNPAAVLDLIDLIRKQEARIDELTEVTGDQHARLDAVLKLQAGLIDAFKAMVADAESLMVKACAALAAAGVTL